MSSYQGKFRHVVAGMDESVKSTILESNRELFTATYEDCDSLATFLGLGGFENGSSLFSISQFYARNQFIQPSQVAIVRDAMMAPPEIESAQASETPQLEVHPDIVQASTESHHVGVPSQQIAGEVEVIFIQPHKRSSNRTVTFKTLSGDQLVYRGGGKYVAALNKGDVVRMTAYIKADPFEMYAKKGLEQYPIAQTAIERVEVLSYVAYAAPAATQAAVVAAAPAAPQPLDLGSSDGAPMPEMYAQPQALPPHPYGVGGASRPSYTQGYYSGPTNAGKRQKMTKSQTAMMVNSRKAKQLKRRQA
jgi:hypothetical protein